MVSLEFVDLLEIKDLLKHQHVVGALVSLERGSMRYGELGNAISAWTGSRIMDGELTRTVHRLEDGRLVRVTVDNEGHKHLALTAAGRRRLYRYALLGRALRAPSPDDGVTDPDAGPADE